ncbi:MAG: hypothetical protein JKY70_06785 [Mucilaginibacter sp.]|nr:hypothetical protein [Mucilaginibacter sp.]
MANWCSNTVWFTGEPHQVKGLRMLFREMAIKEKQEDRGQLPSFMKDEKDWFFNIECDGEMVHYETRWSPNVGVLKQVADHYGSGFHLYYCETGNLVYGEATYTSGELNDISLEPGDFDLYAYEEDKDEYLFEGDSYGSSEDIMEILLERKKRETAKAS